MGRTLAVSLAIALSGTAPAVGGEIACFLDGALRRAAVVLGEPLPPKLIVRPRDDATSEQKALLEGWLAPRVPR